MKKLASILLAALIFAVSAKDVVMWVSFKFNQSLIASSRCINLDKPMIMCSGQCYLVSTIRDGIENSAQPDQKGTIKAESSKFLLLFFQTEDLHPENSAPAVAGPVFPHLSMIAQAGAGDVFQPPRA